MTGPVCRGRAGQDVLLVEGVEGPEADEGVPGGDGQPLAVGVDGEQGAAHAVLAEHGHQSFRLPGVDLDGGDGPLREGVEEAAVEGDTDGRAELERIEILGVVIVRTGGLLGLGALGARGGRLLGLTPAAAAQPEECPDTHSDEEGQQRQQRQAAAAGSRRRGSRTCGRRRRGLGVAVHATYPGTSVSGGVDLPFCRGGAHRNVRRGGRNGYPGCRLDCTRGQDGGNDFSAPGVLP
jgi:hypothetical protein